MILLVVVCALSSLAVDLGRVQLAKTELASAADAAARAASAALPNGVAAAQSAAVAAAAANRCDGQSVALDPATDLQFGVWNPDGKTFTALSGSARSNANAVRVNLDRSAAGGDAIPLMFAKVLGRNTCDVRASTTTCLTGRASAYAIIGLDYVTMNGTGYTDSYNSSSGPYVAGSARLLGSIASNGNLTIGGSSRVSGDVRYGPGRTGTVNSGATVTGLVAPLGAPLSFASAKLPASYYDVGDCVMSSGSVSVPGGVYVFDTIDLSGTAHINWEGPVTFYVRNAYKVSGSVTINTHANLPRNRVIYFLPTCKTATWTGSHSCVGELYAPDTDFTISGSAQLFGRIIAKSITLNSGSGMHYDEALPPYGNSTDARFVTHVQ